MTDYATQSTHRVSQQAGTIGGNAPPTPPETQELKGAEPVKAAEAPRDLTSTSALEPSKDIEQAASSAAPTSQSNAAPIAAPEGNTGIQSPPAQPESATKAAETPGDQLAAQHDKPSENLTSAVPVNAEPSAQTAPAADELSKQPAKPVTVEEIQDPEGPTVKPSVVSDAANPQTSATTSAPKVPEESNGAATTDAQPSVTTGITKPEPIPAVSGPAADESKIGQKRKATDDTTTNGDIGPEDKDIETPAEKKQKSSPVKNVFKKVGAAVKKAGRPKKDKKEPAPPGKTARVTRSQGKASEL